MATRRGLSRWGKRILIAAGVTGGLLVALLLFLLGTTRGGKLALDTIILPLLPGDAEVAQLSGRLWGTFELVGLESRHPGLEARADRVTVRWQPRALFARHVRLHRLELEGVRVRVVEPVETDSVTASEPASDSTVSESAPPLSNLPVRITFDSVIVDDLAASIRDSTELTGGSLRLAGSLDRYSVAFEASVHDPSVVDVEISLAGDGTPERLRLTSLRADALGGSLDGTGAASWWPHLVWQLELAGQDLQPAALMPDPADWPGALSIAVRTSGSIQPESGLEIEATVDWVRGDLRGEPVSGQLSGRLANGVLDLEALRMEWGPARVSAGGSYAEIVDIDFEASVPDIGLALPGSSGSVAARGRLSGTAAGPRVVADFEAHSIELGEGRLALSSAEGAVDLDLSEGGGMSGNVTARSILMAEQALDSATVELRGTRPAHTLAIQAEGPSASLRLDATGGLSEQNSWRGIVASLEVVEDSIFGSWSLADPVEITVASGSVQLGQACLVSEPARVCAAGTSDAAGIRFTAEARGLALARAEPFLPQNLDLDVVLEADADLSLPAAGPITGRVEARTTAGTLTVTPNPDPERGPQDEVREAVRRFDFAPASLLIEAGPDSFTSTVNLAVSDSIGAPVIVLDGLLSTPPLHDFGDLLTQSAAAHLDLEVTDLSLLPVHLGDWTIEGNLLASAEFRIDEQHDLTGTINVDAAPAILNGVSGGEQVRLLVQPARLDFSADETGVRASADISVSDGPGAPFMMLAGQLTTPPLNGVDSLDELWGQSATGHIDLQVTDLSRLPVDLGEWTAEGRFLAAAEFELDEERNARGTLGLDAAPVTMNRVTRGRQVRVTIEPARLDVIADDTGVRASADVAMSSDDSPPFLVATGSVVLPGLTRIDADLDAQSVEGRLEIHSPDLAFAQLLGDLASEARGSFDLTADLGGTLGEVAVVGDAQLRDGRLVLPDLGLELTAMQLSASGGADGSVSVSGELQSGPGRIVLEGSSPAAPSAETPTRVAIRGERFQILDRPEIQLQADPDLELAFDGSTATVTGEILIPTGRFEFQEIPQGAVTRSPDVIIVGDTLTARRTSVPVGLDVQVTLGDDIFFRGLGLTSQLAGSLRILQEPGGEVRGRGEIVLVNGTFRQLGQEMRVEPGRLVFSGPLGSPSLDVRAFVRARDGTEAGLQVGGTPQQLTMEPYSQPQKSESETMSYILFGRGLNETSGGQGDEANNAAAILGANVLTMSLAPSVGLDEARIETGSSQDRAQFVLGKYLTPKLYVGYGVGIYQPISTFRIRYLLSSKWSIETISGDERATDLLYRIETGILKSKRSESDDAAADDAGSDDAGSGAGESDGDS